MTESDCVGLYVQRLAELARAMPLREANSFLRGALVVSGEHEGMESIRAAYLQLRDSDDKLEQIASAQLELPLKDGPARPSGQDGHDGSQPQPGGDGK